MSYHRGNDLLDKLSVLLQLHGDPILRQESQLCLTATSLAFLNQCFESISDQQGIHEQGNVFNHQQIVDNKDRKAITFLHDFLRRTPSLRLVPGACSHFDGLINVSCFRALQVLEIKKVPVGFITGIQSLRPQLKTLACKRSLISLNEVFDRCGGDLSTAPSAWPQLKNVDLSYNGIVQVDDSVKLLPAAEVLNLSHNSINITEDDESLVNWEYLSDIQHLNLGFNQLECIPVPPAQGRTLIFKNMTTLLLKNNNLQNLKGLQAFSKLRVLDVSFNCIAALSELAPLAFLHDLISLNLQGNPVVFCAYYRRATIACLYPIPRVEPIKLDGKPLDSEEQVLLGRNVHPVSMLSYIPETSVTHHRVKTIRKVEEDLMESSESQEESNSPSKPRKPKRRNKKGRRVVTREIDFDDDKEGLTSPTDELLTGPSTSTATPIDQALEHANDVEDLKKLRQLGGEGWLPAIDHVVHAQEQEQIAPVSVHVSAESLLDHASSVIRTESTQSFTDNTIEINSPSSTFSILSDEDIPDGHHFVVTVKSPLDEAEGGDENLFLTVRDNFIIEKNFAGKVISRLETSLLRDVNVGRTEDNHSVIHLRFDYINRERQSRDYTMEDYETAVQLAEVLEPFVTAKGETRKVFLERLQCLKCSAEFRKPVDSDDAFCPDCGSSLTVQVSSPVIQVEPVFTLDHVTGHVVGKHKEASKLNVSSIKTLNGDMSVTPLHQLSSSSSSSSFVEATEEIQKVAKTGWKITSAEDKGLTTNGIGAAKHPDVVPKSTESSDQSPTVPDLCTNTKGKTILIENGKDSSSGNGNVQKKYVVKDSGRFKVNENEKYGIKDRSSPQIRTSALTSSLKQSGNSYLPPRPDISSTQAGRNVYNIGAQNSNGIARGRSKQADVMIDNRPSTPLESKSDDSDQGGEFMSQSLPTNTANVAQKRPPKTSTRKISEQYSSGRSPVTRKFGRSVNTDRGPTKSTESTPQQTKMSSSLPRTPTPKLFFNNLINRLKPGTSPSSLLDSRSSSSGTSSRPTTPSCNVIEPNAALNFRLTADEFSNCDHKLKLYFEVSLFRWGSKERFCCLLKAPVVIYGDTEETPAVMIVSSNMFYLCRFSVRGSGTPDECLTPLVSHPLDSLHFIDRGLGSQSFRLEFSAQGACYDFLVRDKDRCEEFLNVFTNVVHKAKTKADSRPVVVSPPHPQTLAHIRSQVFKIRPEDPILMGERLHQQAVHFVDPPLIKDRKSLLGTYSSCFVGREFVDWLIHVKEVETRVEGVEIGQLLLNVGALEHVSKKQVFEDKDQYYRFSTERNDLAGDSFAGESIPDMDSNIVLFIMAFRCSNTERPDSSLNAVSVIASRSHIAIVKQNPQWPVPRYTALSQPLKDPAFVCLARHKITDVTSLDFFEDDSCFMGISITDEDAPVGNGESQWILKTETFPTLSSLVKVIKEPWEAQFGVELQKNLYPSVMEHNM
ncbi:serine/threonine-protein kinase 11-interacting protein-like [Stylophora pistillata]|uniref:serine/threonine-protein kinase 11-interacting protein-like n=1 Tax=Stylophora pistillata TaxID=50429 RepID=UPI000C04891A|nr:serine/threonine-protein kinase 11-interacting protein-like [Stylophora pistillata]